MMEGALAQLACNGEREFLHTSRIVLELMQNILDNPSSPGHRKVRSASKFLCRPGVVELLSALGFQRKDKHYVLPEGENSLTLLRSCMKELISRRRQTANPLGWDLPSSALHFNRVLSMSKYGDVFQGHFNGKEVAIKTLKPDCSSYGRDSFEREIEILTKLSHAHIVELLGITVLSEPNSIILELVPHRMLDLLHQGELTDLEIFRYAKQVAAGMSYIHSQNFLHCDVAARNLLVSAEGEVKITDFSLSRRDGTVACGGLVGLTGHDGHINFRWMAPEVLRQGLTSMHADVWSYGVLLYEFVTAGSVPYANLSNLEVKSKVLDGYRLAQPHTCLNEFYAIMIKCWSLQAAERPTFHSLLTSLLDPLESKLVSYEEHPLKHAADDPTQCNADKKKKPKVKELSYFSLAGKGGVLLRVYTALVSPFHARVVVVCGKKTTAAEAVQIALAKCGKSDLDHKSHSIALVDDSRPARYLAADERLVQAKTNASNSAQFILCVHSVEQSVLEMVGSIKLNMAYQASFDVRTRGYLVKSAPVRPGKGSLKPKNCSGWQRFWCVLDGSTLLCYGEEEDEGVKQFENFLDFRGCSVSLLSEKKGNFFKVELPNNDVILLTSMDKGDTLRWVEAVEASIRCDPSPMLLLASGGAIVQTGFLFCQKFPVGFENFSPIQPMKQQRLGQSPPTSPSHFVPINYGKMWSVLKSTGLLQCMVEGKPEPLLDISSCQSIKVTNPQTMKEGADYSIRFQTKCFQYVVRAEMPTDHFDWLMAIECILAEAGLRDILTGDKYRESGYVALKRLVMMQKTGVRGSEIAAPHMELEFFRDLYTDVLADQPCRRAEPDGCEEKLSVVDCPPVPRRGSSAPPPPLPPRDPPPLPPKRGNSLQRTRSPSMASTMSNGSIGSFELDEYVIMQSPQSLKLSGAPSHTICCIPSPISEGEDYMPMKPSLLHSGSSQSNLSTTQPISIPHGLTSSAQRPPKRSVLLRTMSESSDSPLNSASDVTDVIPPLPPRNSSPRNMYSSSQAALSRGSSSSSLSRNPSNTSLHSTSNPRNHLDRSQGGYCSTLLGKGSCSFSIGSGSNSPLIHRSNSTVASPRISYDLFGDTSVSDGMIVREAKQHLTEVHPYSNVSSVPHSLSSDTGFETNGLSSSSSSTEDISQILPLGWNRGFCQSYKRIFYFNSTTGVSTWDHPEMMLQAQQGDKSVHLGRGWCPVNMDDGRVYYYHETTRETTWNIHDTLCSTA